MDSAAKKELVRTFFDSLWTEPDKSRSLATDDVTWVTCRGLPIPGADGIEHVGWDAVMHVAHSGLKIDTGYIPTTMTFPVREVLDVEGDRAIFRFTMTCDTKAGRSYINDYLFFVELRDGKVARFQEYWDTKQAFDLLLGDSHT
ncbi:MAG TPA: nuclear transport factor 2 family protein [Acidimicrobiales bacterium]|nr:nuclear transport factor 2 family protein [Acidimicrobiales bacterium]